MPTVRTIAAPVRVEIPKIKGSRFVADVFPAPTEVARSEALSAVVAAFGDASHHCWGWRRDSGYARSSDDGEPGGTAGEPILRRIDGADVVEALVVVTRWFGGTKFGKGGLVRAYGEAAAAGLAAAAIVETRVTAELTLSFAYALQGAVRGVVAAHGGTAIAASYGEGVVLTVSVPVECADDLRAAVLERCAGRVEAVRSES